MKRIERMNAILLLLQSKKIITAQEIANKHSISLRTVYRDIRSLEESGVPIGAEAGIGYFLNESYTLPPVMFTTEEAFALVTAAPFIKSMTTNQTLKSFDEALLKIKAIMPNDQKERLANLESKISVKTGIVQPSANESAYLFTIQQALADSKLLSINYRAGDATNTEREIKPLTLCYYMLNWHLIAHCTLRNEIRDFRLDRITNLELSKRTFQRIEFNLEDYFKNGINKTQWHQIKLEVDESALPSIEISKYWYGFIEQKAIETGAELRFINPDLTYFAKWLLTITPSPKIIEPQALLTNIKDLVNQLSSTYL